LIAILVRFILFYFLFVICLAIIKHLPNWQRVIQINVFERVL